jgi:hypothetical protein
MIFVSKATIVLEINDVILNIIINVLFKPYKNEHSGFFNSHLTTYGLALLAKPCSLFKINIKIEKIHIVKNLDENVVMAEI